MNPNMSQMRSTTTTTVAERSRIAWRMRLSSAVRTATACAAVGVATLYGPKFLASHIKFTAFSYLTAVVIVSDATLGDTMRGCWHAFCATAQVVPLAVLGRWAFDPTAGMPASAASAAVAVASFLVALPECTHMTAKKIAFGQIVLICSDAVLGDGSSYGYMHPLYVAASTALGVLASVLALLVPYPGLACHRVQELCRLYGENASERMDIYLQAVTATDNRTKMELISQAKPLSETGAKLLQSIKTLEDGLRWEKPWSKVSPRERLESMEQQMRGIEYSLISSAAITIQAIDQEQLSDVLQAASTRIQAKIEQVRCYSPFHSKIESEAREFIEKPSSSPLESNPSKLKHGWLVLYFSCICMFLNDTVCSFAASRKLQTPAERPSIRSRFKHWIQNLTSYERLEFASKCSISLSLAMLLGLTFDKENGCWAGLTLAISFVSGRQAIFTVANSRVQGTAIGSVYGVICCFIFHYEELRLLALLPWIVCTSFLRYSKMYGQTGGVSAAIGALVILGRKNYGAPNEFAISRLTEVFIGLTAYIVVEIFLQPIRAATLARNHTDLTLLALQECIKDTGMEKSHTASEFLELIEKQRILNSLLSELKQYVADAELEPDFWYLPFRSSCYQKLVGSLSNILDMLYFITHNLETLSKLSETEIGSKFQEQIRNELEILQETLISSHILSEQAITNQTLAVIEEEMEAGKLCNREKQGVLIQEQIEAEWAAREDDDEDGRNIRERVTQCLSVTRFCITSVMKELEDIVICRREIDQWQK
ncbi:hypothetical protein C2S51_034923 [Perilla frutescens var. frutescens]|nr:hypothetical protein C2S51_034923 [Perilla frutescens var. frutescens]